MKLKRAPHALAGALILGVTSQFAGAVATLRLSDGINTMVIADGSIWDQSMNTGAVSYFGSLGNWNLTFSVGLTKPEIGSATTPAMDLVFLAKSAISQMPSPTNTSPAGCNLVIEFSETGFGPLNPGVNYAISIGGTTVGSVTDETLVDVNNNLFSGMSLGAHSFVPTPPSTSFSKDTTATGTGTAPFSITRRITICHTHKDANGNYIGEMVSSGDAYLTVTGGTPRDVPDGGTTIALFGISLLGLGALRKQLRK